VSRHVASEIGAGKARDSLSTGRQRQAIQHHDRARTMYSGVALSSTCATRQCPGLSRPRRDVGNEASIARDVLARDHRGVPDSACRNKPGLISPSSMRKPRISPADRLRPSIHRTIGAPPAQIATPLVHARTWLLSEMDRAKSASGQLRRIR